MSSEDAAVATVVMSERLGAIGDIEQRIPRETGALLVSRPLWTVEDLLSNGADADVLIVGASEPVNRDVLGQLSRTRCVVRRGVGVDNVDTAAATDFGIPVAYIPDASVEEVSDHALALLLAAERRIVDAHAATTAGDPGAAGTAVGRSRRFGDLTLGIIGFGRIGRALARKASSVFGDVLAYDPLLQPGDHDGLGARIVSFDELLAASHLLSLHAAAAPDAPPLLDAAAFAKLPSGAIVVNAARGKFIDESALLDALEHGQVAVAALDVTAVDPLPKSSPLMHRKDVLLTGHTGAKGARSTRSLREGVVDAVVQALRGQSPAHVANPAVLQTASNRLLAAPLVPAP